MAYRHAVFMHWVAEFMAFSRTTEEEALLAHVKIEALQAAIAEANDWILLASVAFGLKGYNKI